MARLDGIPVRDELISRLDRANSWAWPWMVTQVVIGGVLAWWIDWERVTATPGLAVLASLVVAGPHLMGGLMLWAQNKKEIGDLKESTRFGPFDKHRLRELMDDTLHRLSLPLPGPRVYITADKSLNAAALDSAGLFHWLAGIYLHRQVLHRLTPHEVQDILGHELGHLYQYFLISTRSRWLTVTLGVLAGLLVTQWIDFSGGFSWVALGFCGSVFWYVGGLQANRHGEAIEYLCDDYGAHVHGAAVAINGLLKITAEQEMHASIMLHELRLRRHPNLTPQDVVAAVESAIPYGGTSHEELQRAVAHAMKHRAEAARRLSVNDFLAFAWRGDGESDELEQELKKHRALQEVPRLPWESLLDRPGDISLDEHAIERLVSMMEAHPDHVLFRLASELGHGDGVHPPTRSRILYLWKNRRAIEGHHVYLPR